MRVTVVGAGVAGLATATTLAERGAKVALFERARGPRRQRLVARGRHARALLRGRERAHRGGRARAARDRLVGRASRPALCARARWSSRRRATSARSSASRGGRTATSGWTRRASPRSSPISPGRFHKGLFFAGEGHLDPRAALRALADELSEQRGRPALRRGRRRGSCPEAGIVLDCRGFAARAAFA